MRRNIFALLLISVIILSLFIYSKINHQITYVNWKVKITDLSSTVETSLGQTQGKYGIYIKNLKTQETYLKNEDSTFKSGSLYKLKVMQLTFQALKDGKLTEGQAISADIKALNQYFDIPDEDAELKDGTINFTVKSALEQMITISHNYAALTLTKTLKANNLAVDITPLEIGQFFEKLYKGEVIDPENSTKMLDLLSRQKINDRIPKDLPQGTKVAHKTADIDFFEHDAGIVYSPKGGYVIVVLTESDNPTKAGEKIAEISKTVYDYFNK